MTLWRFDGLLTHTDWMEPAFVSLDGKGKITSISPTQPPNTTAKSLRQVKGYALPGFANGHSHIFQYAMAGCAEFLPKQSQRDDFWSWRTAMYHLASTLDPDQLQNIAAMGYAEMLRLGITSTVEFHYLHHDKNGAHYKNPAELSERLLAAAAATGMRLTLVPVFYQNSNFDKPANADQQRFIFKSVDEYLKLIAACKTAGKNYPTARFGVGVHSLRAASQADAKQLLNMRDHNGPVHIHAAEQEKEVAQCKAAWGKRPIEWILEHIKGGPHLNVVHATHMNEHEITGLAKADATVVICPSTEGDLGDGLFPLIAYNQAGGRWCIGTDSHIGMNFAEELRWLDYTQRLQIKARNPLAKNGGDDSAWLLFKEAMVRGRAACGNYTADWFAVGEPFDSVVIDADAPILAGRKPGNRLASYLYSGDATAHLGTILGGEWITEVQRHQNYGAILAAYQKTMRQLELAHNAGDDI